MNPYMLKSLPLAAASLERIVALVPQSRYDEKTDPDRFSLREAIAHLADWEPFFFERIQQAAEVDGYEIVPYDESQIAIENHYETQNVQEALQRFREQRMKTVAYCRTLTEEQLDRKVLHPEVGIMRVSDIINQMSGHDLYHIEHLTQYLLDKTAGTW